MSYWAGQVILSLIGAIPVIGPDLMEWVRGDFLVSDATLTRFFALHVIALPLVLVALVIAIAMKVVGLLLVAAMLVIPAAAARAFSSTPERMAVIASLAGCLSVLGGLGGSVLWDLPSGPAIVVMAALVFGLASLVRRPRVMR